MSKGARSVLVFGVYLILLGITLLLVPNLLLSAFSIATTKEVWIRVVGILVLYIGIYYIQAARIEATLFFQWTVYLRACIILFFGAFVLLGYAPASLLLLGVVDLLGAMWTAFALRRGTSRERATT